MNVENKNLLPVITSENDVYPYLKKINQFPILTDEEEKKLAIDWLENGDTKAAQKLVTSHLRLVAKIAMGYKGYGLPLFDLISVGNLGLIQAIRKFDPDKGFRLATYAIWWIRASIQEYVLHSWSLVKIGTTAAQKKLFFNLRKAKSKIGALDEGDMHPDNVTKIASDLGVSETEVVSMNRRLSGGDASLNAMISADGESSMEWQDWLEDDAIDQETNFAEHEEYSARQSLMVDAMKDLNEREQRILQARRLAEPPLTLEDLATEFSVSRERIRQIEVRAFEKLQNSMRELAQEKGLLRDL